MILEPLHPFHGDRHDGAMLESCEVARLHGRPTPGRAPAATHAPGVLP
jgi:hypothetical protein